MKAWPQSPSRVSILGVPVDLLPRSEVEAWLRSVLTGAAAGADDPACRHLVTLNPEYVMAATRDPEFRRALEHADLVTADGVGISLAVRLLFPVYPPRLAFDRVTGVDITEMIAVISAAKAVPVYLLGAGPGVAEAAADRMSRLYPGFALAGTWDGGTPSPADDDDTLDRIRAAAPKAVLVAYGAPGQIHWIVRNQEALAEAGVRLVVGVGGTLDFMSGKVRRAPGWVRRMGCEWLYRLLREPWRWRRQLVLPRFLWRVGLTAIRRPPDTGRGPARGV